MLIVPGAILLSVKVSERIHRVAVAGWDCDQVGERFVDRVHFGQVRVEEESQAKPCDVGEPRSDSQPTPNLVDEPRLDERGDVVEQLLGFAERIPPNVLDATKTKESAGVLKLVGLL